MMPEDWHDSWLVVSFWNFSTKAFFDKSIRVSHYMRIIYLLLNSDDVFRVSVAIIYSSIQSHPSGISKSHNVVKGQDNRYFAIVIL